MPPKKKAPSLFIPAKTLPGRNGRGTIIPPSALKRTKPRAPDLQDKGWLDQEKLAELDRERERQGLATLKKRNGDIKAKETNAVQVEAKVETSTEVEMSTESDNPKAKDEKRKLEGQPEPEPKRAKIESDMAKDKANKEEHKPEAQSEPTMMTGIESDNAKAKEDEHKHEAASDPMIVAEPELESEPAPEHAPVPGPLAEVKAVKEESRFITEKKENVRVPTFWELPSMNLIINEAPELPDISLEEKMIISEPQSEQSFLQPQLEQSQLDQSVSQPQVQLPQLEQSISQPQLEQTSSQPQLEPAPSVESGKAPDLPQNPLAEKTSNSEPPLEPSLESAPADELDEQGDTFWKLIDFFISVPPLPDPPAHPPTPPMTPNKAAPVPPLSGAPAHPPATPLTTTKAAPVLLVGSFPSLVSNPSPALTFSPSTFSAPSTHTPCPNENDDGDKWESMSIEWSDDDPMRLSGWAFAHKPAISIYTPNPWTKPNHVLDTIMTVEVEDGAFDVARWLRDQYDANIETTATCKFEHPGSRPSANPFAPLQNSFQNNNNNSNTPRGSSAADFYLNRESIQKDLQEERPEWILSAYGPGRDAPEQLWGGILEQSPEEMRLHAMTCEAAGNLQGALSDFEMLKGKAQEKIAVAYRDPDAAINWIMSGLNKQPNRLGLAANNMNGEFAVGKRPVGFGPSSAFSTPSANANPFNQPSTSTQTANPFKTGTSGFGQPSTLGQTPNAFGQPTSVFSQPPAMGSGNGFGQPSTLGQQTSAFATPSTAGVQNAFSQGTGFGQPSNLGSKPNPFGTPSPFGQPSQSTPSVPFGQPSQLGAKPSPFSNAAASSGPGASPFGAFANSNAAPGGNPFGTAASSTTNAFSSNNQPNNSPFAQPQPTASKEVSMGSSSAPTTSPFAAAGNPATTAAPFGQPPPTSNAFGQTPAANPFGQPQQPAFGQPSQQKPNPFAPATGPFSQAPSLTAASSTTTSAGPPGNGPYGPNSNRQHPPYSSYAQKDPATGQLQGFKGRPVIYKEVDEKPTPHVQSMDGTSSKIWFPDGAPQYYQDTEPDREHTDAEKALWQGFQQTGKFQLAANGGGGMPLSPPMRESVQWDF